MTLSKPITHSQPPSKGKTGLPNVLDWTTDLSRGAGWFCPRVASTWLQTFTDPKILSRHNALWPRPPRFLWSLLPGILRVPSLNEVRPRLGATEGLPHNCSKLKYVGIVHLPNTWMSTPHPTQAQSPLTSMIKFEAKSKG